MKQFVQLLFFLCITTVTYAQSNLDAKMAYQLAEEKFDAKQYGEALDYLQKAETSLGKKNPPIAYLMVMIRNQIVLASESEITFSALEKAIVDFDSLKDKEAFDKDKLMDVYLIKIDFEKRWNRYVERETHNQELLKQYEEMVYRLADEYPKTNIALDTFFSNIPTSWYPSRYGWSSMQGISKKNIQHIISRGTASFDYDNMSVKQFSVKQLELVEKGKNELRNYTVIFFNQMAKKRKYSKADITLLFFELFNIPKALQSQNTFIQSTDSFFTINYTSKETTQSGQSKAFRLRVEKTYKIGGIHRSIGDDDIYEYLSFTILENTL